jgi:hypothetical protein
MVVVEGVMVAGLGRNRNANKTTMTIATITMMMRRTVRRVLPDLGMGPFKLDLRDLKLLGA